MISDFKTLVDDSIELTPTEEVKPKPNRAAINLLIIMIILLVGFYLLKNLNEND